MKTQVTLNEKMIKTYYNDLFLKNNLFILILVLIAGSTSAGIYIVRESNVWAGIAIEVITIFTMFVIVMINRNNMKTALKELNMSERTYYFEFTDSEMIVTVHKDTEYFKYISLKSSRLRHFVQFKTINKKIYIIELTKFKANEWQHIYDLMMDVRKAGIHNGTNS